MRKVFWLLLIINVLLFAFIVTTFEPNAPPPLLPQPDKGNIEMYSEPTANNTEAQNK